MLAWLNGSDNPPPADVEKMYISSLKQYQWPNPFISSATAKQAEFSGASGVKMEGPYEWVPADYWLLDKTAGGAHGFATEISPGPAVPPLESLERMIPREHLWPIDDVWNFHAGGGQFKNIKVFSDALNARYGKAKDVSDYAAKSQLMTYEGQRAMFEAYAGNRYQSTGVIQWMMNNAWPSLIWHLYDYYLMPGGGYFGTKKACEPIHVQYSYNDRAVVAVNTTSQSQRNLKLTARVYDVDSKERFSKVVQADLAPDSNFPAFSIPGIRDLSATYFLKLTLENSKGEILSSNFYWLSTKDDVLDANKTKWYYTPVSSYADMTQLDRLSRAKLSASGTAVRRRDEEIARVTISNPGNSVAFFIQLQVKQKGGDRDILPVFWQDNYISLLPGERREITATYKIKDLGKAEAFVLVEGWNSPPIRISLQR
jgi:exo-1,4-beta-D-glucosaminidase